MLCRILSCDCGDSSPTQIGFPPDLLTAPDKSQRTFQMHIVLYCFSSQSLPMASAAHRAKFKVALISLSTSQISSVSLLLLGADQACVVFAIAQAPKLDRVLWCFCTLLLFQMFDNSGRQGASLFPLVFSFPDDVMSSSSSHSTCISSYGWVVQPFLRQDPNGQGFLPQTKQTTNKNTNISQVGV